jgi:DNA-binding response OmpR family regulator
LPCLLNFTTGYFLGIIRTRIYHWQILKPTQPQSSICLSSPLKLYEMCCLPNTIIIADDDADDSLFLVEALRALNLGLVIINVPNGQMLVNMLDSISPSFIFLDINMPKMNGFEALKQIRSNKTLDHPTVIMCSTTGAQNEIKMSQEFGADLYLKKPNDLKNLNKMIDDVFRMDWRNEEKKTLKEFTMNSDRGYDSRGIN